MSPFFLCTTYSLMFPTGVTITGSPTAIASIVASDDVSVRLGRTNMSIACRYGTGLSLLPALIMFLDAGISSSSPSPTMSRVVCLYLLCTVWNAWCSVGRSFSRAILPQNPIILLPASPIFSFAAVFDFGGANIFTGTPSLTISFFVVILFPDRRSATSFDGTNNNVHLLYNLLAITFMSHSAMNFGLLIALFASSHSMLCM